MVSYEKLTKAGIDMDSLLKRLMGNDALVKMFIRKFCEDRNWEMLREAFREQDMKKAEMASHTLKGMCGNLSLMELYGMFTLQVNLIRSCDYDKAAGMMEALTAMFGDAISNMQAWLGEQA